MVAAHLEVPVDGPAADLLQEIVGGLEAPGPRERRRGLTTPSPVAAARCAEPFAVVVTFAMVTVMLMVNVSCDDTA